MGANVDKNVLLDKQNEKLEKDYKKMNEVYSTDNRNNHFKMFRLEYVNTTAYYLFYIYYIVAAGVVYYLYTNKYFSNTMKIFLLILVAAYPFVITSIEYIIAYIFYFAYILIFGIPYRE
jgi:hypothetical protein